MSTKEERKALLHDVARQAARMVHNLVDALDLYLGIFFSMNLF